MSSNLMWLSVDQRRVVPDWLQVNLAANPAVRAQIRSLVNAAGRDFANGAVINALQFPWPPFAEQQRIVSILGEASAHVRAEEATARKLRLLRDGLREDLLTGRVRVAVSSRGAA